MTISYVHAVPITIEESKEENISLFLDGELLKFETQPILINNQVMVPMRPFFESLGAQVAWVEETRTVIAYKSNMFIKLIIDSESAHKNGKTFNLKSPPIIRNQRTLVPAQFIAETFDLKSAWIKENEMNLISESDIPQYYRFGDFFYKKQSFDKYGLSFSIPNYWEELDPERNIYGVKSLENSYLVEFLVKENTTSTSVDEDLEELQLQLRTLYGDVVSFDTTENLSYNSLSGNSFKATLNMATGPEYKVYYLFHDGNKAYNFICSYSDKTAEEELLDIFDNVISTFRIDKISVDSNDEHYIEHPKYYELNIDLDQEIHSNMEVRNSFPFSGTINTTDLKNIYVRVIKDSNTMYSKVEIDEAGHFSSKIYTPYGLGKHDICIMIEREPCIDSDNGLMQFSVINLSSDKIRYIIPSEHVSSDNQYVISQSKLISYKSTSDYSKAKSIFDWIISEITLEDLSSATEHRDSERVYLEKKATGEEITHMYAAMLRAIDIPTRIRTGSVGNMTHHWVEIYLNGKWILSDPVNKVRYGNIDIANDELYANYFILDLGHYDGLFKNIIDAPY